VITSESQSTSGPPTAAGEPNHKDRFLMASLSGIAVGALWSGTGKIGIYAERFADGTDRQSFVSRKLWKTCPRRLSWSPTTGWLTLL
jgi:hypothetical protein